MNIADKNAFDKFSCLDYDCVGVPLKENFTEPGMYCNEKAFQYEKQTLRPVRGIVVCYGNIAEDTLLYEENKSVRLHGEAVSVSTVELKNLSSNGNVKKSIEWAVSPMTELAEPGKRIVLKKGSFDLNTDTTFPMFEKDANDYRILSAPYTTPFKVV